MFIAYSAINLSIISNSSLDLPSNSVIIPFSIFIDDFGSFGLSKRFQVLSERPVNQDGLIGEWADEGLIALDSPNDPKSSIKIEKKEETQTQAKSGGGILRQLPLLTKQYIKLHIIFCLL